MDVPEPPDAEILAMSELFGLSIPECEELRAAARRRERGPERWFRSARGRIRMAAWIVAGGLFVMLGPATVAFYYVSETVAWALFLPAGSAMLLALAAIWVEIRRGLASGEEDESERAVARLVSGKGIDPPA